MSDTAAARFMTPAPASDPESEPSGDLGSPLDDTTEAEDDAAIEYVGLDEPSRTDRPSFRDLDGHESWRGCCELQHVSAGGHL